MQSAPYAPRQRASTKPPANGWSSKSLVKTSTPGIFKKLGARTRPYVVVYRAAGKQRKETCRTLAEARAIKSAREADDARGEFLARSKITLRAYLKEWVENYHGNGRRGFREGTRVEYRRVLDAKAHKFFGKRLRLVDVTPLHIADYVRWLADPTKQNGRRYSDSSIANFVIPVRSALATAKRDGLIRHNPADGVALPNRQQIEEDEDKAKALSRAQLRALVEATPDTYKLLIEVIASTGLRISEAIGLQRRDLRFEDELRPHIRVRRAIVRSRVEPPKSKHGRRKIRISRDLAGKLDAHMADVLDLSDDAWVFASQIGGPLCADNLRARLIKPLMREIGAPWAAWHTLRHTYASLQLARGANIVQLSRALGHHSASFTLDTYIHLLDGEDLDALDLDAEVGEVQDSGGDLVPLAEVSQ
ncbi:MAG: tyrosine-type recombinase/integrase [Thermoleophilaceae bacterium]